MTSTPNSSPRLRAITPDDEPFVRGVFAVTRGCQFRAAGLPETLIGQVMTQQYRAQQVHYRSQYPEARFDLVVVSNIPAGYLYTLRGPAAFALIDVALLPEYRGHGIGARLVVDLIAEAAAAGRGINAHVAKGGRAWRLWQRLGFEVVGDDGVYLAIARPPQVHAAEGGQSGS